MEFVNNAIAIYDKNGAQLVAPISSSNAFLQPASAFLSDPRCYYDAATKHWFFQEFVVGTVNSSGQEADAEHPVPGRQLHGRPDRYLRRLVVRHHRLVDRGLPVLR